MLFSTSAIRRYTPPTCTLKIIGKTSPLSRWSSRPLFKNLRFELNFDDPRKLAEEQVTIAGDREQLDQLCSAVNDYVQDFLTHSAPTRLSSLFELPLVPGEESTVSSEKPSEPQIQIGVDETPEPESQPPSLLPALPPSLKPQGLLSHRLFFGNLATAQSGEGIELSATQLFDLATALDEYGADIAALPELDEQRATYVPTVPWTGIAAVAVLTVGLTTVAIKWQQTPQTTSTASSEPQDLTASSAPEIAPLPLPSPPSGLPSPSPSIPSPLSTLSKLPPPRSVTPPIGQSSPIPNASQQPSGSSPIVIRPNIGENKSAPTQQPSSGQRKPLPQEQQVPVRTSPAPASNPQVASANRAASGSTSTARSTAQTRQAPTPQPTPSIPAALPSLGSDSHATANAPEAGDVASLNPGFSATGQGGPENEELALRNAPQVNQVRNYFQERWQAPENLNEPLEYSLVLKGDGTLERIIPRGQASGTYLDRTPMPLLGESFGISPVDTGEAAKIRLILKPDGSVDARME